MAAYSGSQIQQDVQKLKESKVDVVGAAHAAMPGDVTTSIVTPSSGTRLKMENDGYLHFEATPQSNEDVSQIALYAHLSVRYHNMRAGVSTMGFLPVEKGEFVSVNYQNLSSVRLAFVKANGAK